MTNTYDAEDITRFLAALAAVANQSFGASESETFERLMTIKVVAEDLGKQLTSERPGNEHINWVQHHIGTLERYAANIAERYGSTEARP
ncbi:hypothetical protein ACQEVF_59700 [Nonomuraea polychroma]|uniref:hypothetical protein n=1 Tax=Nonomuraea polychroma TaxID=46176 RepID=UPI003D91622E